MSTTALAQLLVEAADSASAPKLILDAASYAQRVLLQDRDIPWDDAMAYANHLGQAQALLKPVVALVPLDRFIAREVEHNSSLREAMAARSRTGFAARALLSDETFRARAQDIVGTAAKTQREPVVLHLPSPRALLEITARAVAPDTLADIDDDTAESAAIYYADWLRGFASLGVAGVVFDERETGCPEEVYQPILNTAEHYQWPIGVRSLTAVTFASPEAVISVLDPSVLGEESGTEIPSAGVLLAEIPQDAIPERVLQRLESLRTA